MNLELTEIDINQILAALESYRISMLDRGLDGHADDYLDLINIIQQQKENPYELEPIGHGSLPVGKVYYVPDPLNKEYLAREETWRGDGQDHYYLTSGMVYLRKNDAGRAAKRMLPTANYFSKTGRINAHL